MKTRPRRLRFGAPERLACWAAPSPGDDESAGKRRSGRTRHGNNAIRYILCECANAARMTKSTPASRHRSLMVRKSHKKAIVAVAHKMIRLVYILLSRRQPYLDQAIDDAAKSAKKNAPWTRRIDEGALPAGVAAAREDVTKRRQSADGLVSAVACPAPGAKGAAATRTASSTRARGRPRHA